MNFSAGLIAGRGPVEVTADWFRIDVEDRVALTQEIRLGPDEIDVLLSEGILEAMNRPVFRFFVNDFSTRTEGLDVLASWRVSDRTSVRASWNYTVTLVGALGSNVIDDFRVQTLERGLPLVRWQFSAAHERAAWRMNGRVSWYGAYWDSEDGRNAAALGAYGAPWDYPLYSGRAPVDMELGVRAGSRGWLSFGAENVFGAYPEENRFAPLTVGNRYGQFSPFGFSGAYYYGRLSYEWGL